MKSKEILVRYLLGELSPADQEGLEEQYFVSDQRWAELQLAEADLIDSYLRNQLSQSQQQRFEEHFLASPRRRQRLEFARVQMEASSLPHNGMPAAASVRPAPRGNSWFLRGFAIAATGLAIALIVIGIQNLRLRDRLTGSQSRERDLQQRLATSQTANRSNTQNPEATGPAGLATQNLPAVSLLLAPGALRGPETAIPRLSVSSVPSTVLLLLQLQDDRFAEYDVAIRTPEAKNIGNLKALKPSKLPEGGSVVVAKFESKIFAPGDYAVILSGHNGAKRSEVIDSFRFTVTR